MLRLIVILLAACVASQIASAQTLLVSAAASLTNVLPKIAESFERSHAGAHVKFNFGASGALRQQIEQGAPADVFISASAQIMDAVAQKGVISATTRRIVCGDELVLVAPSGSVLHAWAELASPAVNRIAIGDPASVPAGVYAKETLTALGMWDALKSKYVYAGNVRQALAYVDGGNVDAGIVYRTDYLHSGKAVLVAPAPPNTHSAIEFPAAVVARSAAPDLANAFVEFMISKDAQQMFQSDGFTPAKH